MTPDEAIEILQNLKYDFEPRDVERLQAIAGMLEKQDWQDIENALKKDGQQYIGFDEVSATMVFKSGLTFFTEHGDIGHIPPGTQIEVDIIETISTTNTAE